MNIPIFPKRFLRFSPARLALGCTSIGFLLSTSGTSAASTPLVELRFEEASGTSAANAGTLGGSAVFTQPDEWPVFSDRVPVGPLAPANNTASVDLGAIGDGQGGRAIDLTTDASGTLGALNAFTISAWVNARDLQEGYGGNRIAFALESPNGAGFDLVQLSDGALRIGINQWPDAGTGGPRSSAGRITADPEAGTNNWVYLAVTYDPALPSGQLKYYFGKPGALASLDSEHTYLGGLDNGGLIEYSGILTLGNFGEVVAARTETGTAGGSRNFRGLLDEVKIYGEALSPDDIQRAQLNGEPPPSPVVIVTPPATQTVFEGEPVTLDVQASGSSPLSFQWQRNDTAIPGATNRSLNLPGATETDHLAEYRVVVSNSINSITSAPAILMVLAESHHKIALSFSEGSGTSTVNAGNLAGEGTFAGTDGFPIFSTAVPTGPFAPAGNVSSIDFGGIDEGQGGRAIDVTNAYGNTLRAMVAFTATGWLNARDLREGYGGNRIAFALASPNGPGFDLVQLASGALRLGVNQWPDGANGGGPQSTEGRITEDPSTGAENWVFFAVTYDSTLASGQVKYYFGSPTAEVTLDSEADYPQGEIRTSGPLTVGNFSSLIAARNEVGPAGGSRVFRGLIDEIHIENRALSLTDIAAIQKAPIAVEGPRLTNAKDGSDAVITWNASGGYRLQSATELRADAWSDATETPVVDGLKSTVRVAITGSARYFRLRSEP